MSEQTAERKHHPHSPSSLQSKEACPKYTNRKGPVHIAAVTGTRQHDAVESQLDDPRLADFRAAAVMQCIEYCEERAKLYPGGTVLKEEYLPIDDNIVTVIENGLPVQYKGTTAGYLDFAVISQSQLEAEIIDFKFGQNEVEDAKNNVQGMSYLLGILKRYPKLQSVKVTFLMPHLDLVTEHPFHVEGFNNLRLRITTIVHRAIEANKDPEDFSMAKPAVSACLFCDLIGKCPKVAEVALKLGKKYAPLEIPETVTPSLVSDPKDVTIGIRLAQVVAVWADAFKRQATSRSISNRDFIPEGYFLVESQKRKVLDAQKVLASAGKFLEYKDVEALKQFMSIPLGEVEEAISLKMPRGSKERTVSEFNADLLATGAVELGEPFAFLRQSRKTDTKQDSKTKQ